MESLGTEEMLQLLMNMAGNVQAKADLVGSRVAQKYQNNPPLPYGQSVTVLAIGAINYDATSSKQDKCLGLVRYGHFQEQWPGEYPKGEDPRMDYMDEEQVSPAYIKYCLPNKPDEVIIARTKMLIWFPLNDIFTQNIIRMQQTKVKGFPIPDVFIDEGEQWVATLANFARGVKRYCSGPNKDPSIKPDVPGCA